MDCVCVYLYNLVGLEKKKNKTKTDDTNIVCADGKMVSYFLCYTKMVHLCVCVCQPVRSKFIR
jgi:hypothetical protein